MTIKAVQIAVTDDRKFLVYTDETNWRQFSTIEDALVDVSLELGERGICIQRETQAIEVHPELGRPFRNGQTGKGKK